MTVFVDDPIWLWKGRKWCHLMADEIDELHRFAKLIGLHRLSYQGPPKTSAPHYDITGFERDRALRLGALPCGRAEIVELYRRQKTPRNRRTPRNNGVPAARSVRPATGAPEPSGG